jgi:mono/diheme cytochrome c family protein
VVALLVVVAAGTAGLALYFGFLPGPGSLLGARRGDALPDDSTLAKVVAQRPAGAAGAPALDTTAMAGSAPPDSATVVTSADSAAGDAVYHGVGKCVGCHGITGEGAPGLGPSLRVSPGRLGDGSVGAVGQIVTRGAPPTADYRIAMPSYAGQLSADEVAYVAAYVYSLSHPALPADSAPLAGSAPSPLPPASPQPAVPRPTVPQAAAGAPNAGAPLGGATAPATPPVRHPTVPAPPASPPRRP